MKYKTNIIISGILGLTLAMVPTANAAEIDAQQKTEIETIIREYLLKNPELLTEMSQSLEVKQRETEAAARTVALKNSAKDIFRLAGDAVVGNPNGDVTIVEFLDYNCGWCKRAVAELGELVKEDTNLRVVFKEFPIFGEGSDYAARAAIAADRQGKYWEFHQALFAQETQVNAAVVDEVAGQIGLDVARMKADMSDPVVAELLIKNRSLATSLMLNGTPAFVVDDQVAPGYLPKSQLASAVQNVRTEGGCKLC